MQRCVLMSSQATGKRNTSMFLYLISVVITTGGLAYAAVPLYQMFCQACKCQSRAHVIGYIISSLGMKNTES